MEFLNVPLWPVLALAVLAFIIAMIWYGPLFGRQWVKLAKLKKTDMKNQHKIFPLGFINTFIITFFVCYFVLASMPDDWIAGVILGSFLAFGFIGTTLLSDVLWEKKPFDLYLLDFGYRLVTFALTGGLIVYLA